MKPSDFFNNAGGVRYHLRARRYSASLWNPFRLALGQYLLGFRPGVPSLLVVGPSAGYCMQPFLFEQFERVVCLEPDPLARFLFARKLRLAPLERRPSVEFIAEDHLVRAPERLPRLAESLGPCALLFTNVLGQLRGLLDVESTEASSLVAVRNAVEEAIAGRSFASYHDRVSGNVRPSLSGSVRYPSRLSDDELLSELYSGPIARKGLQTQTLLDHLTEGFFPEKLPHDYFVWQLEPGRFHLIEGVMRIIPEADRSTSALV